MSIFGRRAELYDFAYGVAHFRYCNLGRAVDYQAQTYQGAGLDRSSIRESADNSSDTLDVTAPLSLPLLDLFRPLAPMSPVALVLQRQTLNGATATIWTGEVGSVEFAGAKATIHCVPPLASLQAQGLTRNWQKQCPLTLYSSGLGQCNVDRTSVSVSATITAVAGNVVHAAAFAAQADGWWRGGYIEWNDGTVMQRRFITDDAGDSVTLMTPAAPLAPGTVVTALPGCDHTLETCHNKFHNDVNYGGQPGIPEVSPMSSTGIF